MNQISSHKIKLLGGVVFSILLIIVALTLATGRLSYSGRASSSSEGTVSLSRENSYLFASPVVAKADGTSFIRITVYVLNTQGLGIKGQKITLNSSKPLNIGQTQPLTDSFGRAIFDLSATTPGDYTVSGEVAGVSLPQTVSVSFQ